MRVLYVYSRRNTFTRIDRELLAERHDVVPYYQPGARPRPLELRRGLRDSDVVFGWHASWHTLAALGMATVWRRPSVLVIGGFDTASVPEIGYGNQQDRLRRWRARLTISRATRLLTNSRYSIGEIERNLGIPGDQVAMVYHGVADRFGPPAERREPIALSVGVVDRSNLDRKGHLEFVRAASSLPEVRFVLAGGWSDDGAIERLRAEASPNVTFTGYLSDEALDDLFRRAAVYVQASWHEGFGLAVAEAMLAGCVPVVTEIGALPEVVGSTGVRVPAVDGAEIAAGVRRALEEAPQGGHRARARVLERFPIEARRDGILSELEAAAEAGGAKATA